MRLNEIVYKKALNKTVTEMDVYAPLIAKKAEPGEFIILRVNEKGERIPLTIAGYNRDEGTIKIIFQIVGATTLLLNELEVGDVIHDFVGPLGNETDLSKIKKALVVAGGVGAAIALPIVQKLNYMGYAPDVIVGFRNKDLVILEEEFKKASSAFYLTTDDGSYQEKALVTDVVERLLEKGNTYDEVIAIGPLPMMKYVTEVTKKYNVKTTVSMNPIMIDGTGMCGGCRLTVDGKTRFACVDGPDFDGFKVDFDEAISRSKSYIEYERKAYDRTCHLLKKGDE